MVTTQAAPAAVLPGRRVSRGLWADAFRRLWHDRVTVVSFVVLFVLVVLAAAAELLSTQLFRYGFTQQNLLNNYAPPDLSKPAFWLGGDELGRSQIVRLLYGARISLAVGFGAAFLNLTLGITLGLASGYFRGWFDDLVQFVITTLNSIPAIYLLLIIAVLFSPGPLQLVIILGLLNWPGITLFVRGQTLSLREREFVTAAHVLGARDRRIMFQHILPNVLPLCFILSAIDIGGIILVESALSFLGLGILPPTPSWGNMLTNAASNLSRGPWLVYGPGAAIFVTVLCLYLIGDGLRDALDPKQKRS
ncbi:MAG: ABC transporter permease [Chloroflexi bacterium]|nr:ABC transporter permease [Chloroflexota bacterium]